MLTKGKFKIADVNSELQNDLITKFKVSGYPTLLLFKNGEKITEYTSGARKAEDFVEYLNFVTKQKKNENGEILELDDENFEVETSVFDTQTFVKFYSPNCGYCKQMKPEWKKLANHLKGTSIRIAEIDCTIHKAPCERFEIKGYPTLKFFFENRFVNYNGNRNVESFEKFVKNDWKEKKKHLKPEVRTGFQFNWKWFILAIVLASVLCCICVVLLFWLTDDDESEEEKRIRREYKKFKKEEKILIEKEDKQD